MARRPSRAVSEERSAYAELLRKPPAPAAPPPPDDLRPPLAAAEATPLPRERTPAIRPTLIPDEAPAASSDRYSLLDPDPPGWPNGEPHPAHGPAHLLPRDADGRLSAYYYCSPQEIAAHGFTPPNFAVARRTRQDGMTPEKQRLFVETLARTASVRAACDAAGVSRTAAYNLRNAPHAHAFRAAWTEATRSAVQVLADTAFQRAVEGVEEPVYWRGEHIGFRTRFNDRLLMFLLRVRDPANYAPLRELGAWQQVRPVEGHPAALAAALDRLDRAEPRSESPAPDPALAAPDGEPPHVSTSST